MPLNAIHLCHLALSQESIIKGENSCVGFIERQCISHQRGSFLKNIFKGYLVMSLYNMLNVGPKSCLCDSVTNVKHLFLC